MRSKIFTASLVTVVFVLCSYSTARAQFAVDSFNPNPNGPILAMVTQPDGKIIIGGTFTAIARDGGPPIFRNNIARINPDGSLDLAFNPNVRGTVLALALQPDGAILVGGTFFGPNSIGGQTRNRIARLEPVTGSADSFNPNANDDVL